jgi:ATP-dependent Clp protease ATP-binding subunit ClpB
VSIEHIFLGLITAGEQVGQMMKDSGMTEKEMKLAIAELRKGAKVDSQTAEDTYNALNRFAINLNEMARSGKLDPLLAATMKFAVFYKFYRGELRTILF